MDLSHKEIIGLYIIFQNLDNQELDFSMSVLLKKVDDYVLKNLSINEVRNIKEYYKKIEV